jgi:dephospho-CoA kinase
VASTQKTLTVGLTGGIGSGKSTVGSLLESKGAILIDADAISREVMAPGGAAYGPVLERFGDQILASDKTIDRKALAAVAFADPQSLADLNAATHPAIGQVMIERRVQADSQGGVVVMDVPLLKSTHREELGFDVVVVVDLPVEVAVSRLVEHRGFDRADAEARAASQMTREARLALADFIIDNNGGLGGLRDQVDRLWDELVSQLD